MFASLLFKQLMSDVSLRIKVNKTMPTEYLSPSRNVQMLIELLSSLRSAVGNSVISLDSSNFLSCEWGDIWVSQTWWLKLFSSSLFSSELFRLPSWFSILFCICCEVTTRHPDGSPKPPWFNFSKCRISCRTAFRTETDGRKNLNFGAYSWNPFSSQKQP